MNYKKKLRDLIKKHEGLRYKPYDDYDGRTIGKDKKSVTGKLTIGVGRNLEDVGLSNDEIDLLLKNDLTRAEHMLITFFPEIVDKISYVRRAVLVSMVFNLGMGGFRGFKNMIAALKEERFDDAAYHMLDSKWAGQVGYRAEELAQMMRTNRWIPT